MIMMMQRSYIGKTSFFFLLFHSPTCIVVLLKCYKMRLPVAVRKFKEVIFKWKVWWRNFFYATPAHHLVVACKRLYESRCLPVFKRRGRKVFYLHKLFCFRIFAWISSAAPMFRFYRKGIFFFFTVLQILCGKIKM